MSRNSEIRIVILGTLLTLCSVSPFYVAPDYLAALQRDQGFSLSQLGMVSGAESLAIGLACAATGIVLRRVGRWTMMAAALVCIVGNILSIHATSYPLVLTVRALTGLFGEGPLYALSYAMLGSAANPDRAFGIGVGAVAVCAAAVLAAGGALNGLFGPAAVLVPYVVTALAVLLMAPSSRPISEGAPPPAATPLSLWLRAGALFLSLILWTAAAGAFWAFTETAASVLGIDEAAMSRALSFGLMAGLTGIVIPVALAKRFGRLVPLVLATAGLAGSCFLFFWGRGELPATVSMTVQQICWDVAAVYQLAGIATIDRSGKFSAFGAVGQIAGLALGPALAGAALERFGYAVMPAAVTVTAAVALLLFVVAAREPRGEAAEAPSLV